MDDIGSGAGPGVTSRLAEETEGWRSLAVGKENSRNIEFGAGDVIEEAEGDDGDNHGHSVSGPHAEAEPGTERQIELKLTVTKHRVNKISLIV